MSHQHLRRFRRFLQRHSQVLTVVGALIVFLTFVVNDVLRERLKDMASSIASAQNFLVIRKDLWSIQSQLRTVGSSVDDVLSIEDMLIYHIKPQTPPTFVVETPADYNDAETKHRVIVSDTLGIDAADNLERMSQLMRGMPEDQTSSTELQSLWMGWADLKKIRGGLLSKTFQRESKLPANKVQKRDREDLRAKWLAYYSKEADWSTKVDVFGYRTIKRAEEIRDQTEHRYKLYTRTSYALYTLGWSLALIGKLWGEPGGGGVGE